MRPGDRSKEEENEDENEDVDEEEDEEENEDERGEQERGTLLSVLAWAINPSEVPYLVTAGGLLPRNKDSLRWLARACLKMINLRDRAPSVTRHQNTQKKTH